MDDFICLEVDREFDGQAGMFLWWGDTSDPNEMTFYFTNRAQWRAINSIARTIARYGYCRVKVDDSFQLIEPNDGSVISINS
ncbi:hypothetical protein HQQ92_18995 [Shewanella sp. DC2-4]|uniref:hypothetical protein n=1 Tax=Shewanella sp. DC2-4 TaxID=2739431 RepID=UPI00156501FD|nr:hypothetical protein [Shewanella sp. DC2-4]NRD33819.1 hypothetical protein [Shewanella sp. DC2-4]